jgi:DNA-binding NarL/FixJ family response regulator
MNKKTSILLVEDDLNISTLLLEMLTSNDYDVLHVKDSVKALDVLKNQSFDLILLDEMLPFMNGSEVLLRIKADPVMAKIPVIMMTSIQDSNLEAYVLNEGCEDYIQKPFRFNVLIARIQNVLKRSTKISYPVEFEIPDGSKPENLRPKEKEVLALIIKGYSNSRIAKELFISESTVSNHLQNIFSVLKAESRTQAAIIALKSNIFQ